MPIEFLKFRKNLIYTAKANLSTVIADLQEIAGIDQLAELQQSKYAKRALHYFYGIIGCFVIGFMMNIIIFRSLVTLFLIATIISCSSGKSGDEVSNQSVSQNTPVATNVAAQQEKIKFKTEGGTDLFSLKQEADGAKLVDGKNQELARIKADKSGKIKIKNASEKVLGYVVTEKGSWKLKNANQSQDLYILRRQNDGDYKLEDATKKEVYRIKARNDGFEIETPDKKSVYQVKVKEGKTSLRKANSKTIFSTKSQLSPIAFTCFGFDVLTREQQAALAYAVNLTGGK